ncbi:MAG: DUF2244 domain-containing protein [Hyphomicrobiales bacterium]|nr:MAG: DUF2244 domain-containing protein [Hyphomicrobiales bacterium]
MSSRNPDSGSNDVIFSALLTPHRSLGPRGFLILMMVTGGLCFYAGVLFWAVGAWPVVGFLGLDVLLVWFAFRMSYRSGRAYEEVGVSQHMVIVRKVSPGGRAHEFRFNPHWVRLAVHRIEDEGCVHVALTGQGEKLDIGTFLNPKDRESFARAFADALMRARSPLPVPTA